MVVEFPFQNGAASYILQKVNLTIVNFTECERQLGQTLQASQICAAGTEERNACFVSIHFYTRLIII
jgi:hypothetical protein